MNRIEFYNKLDKFKKDLAEKAEQDTLCHRFSDRDGQDNKLDSNGNAQNYKVTTSYNSTNSTLKPVSTTRQKNNYGTKYYTKIDNYYPDGSARYFYSREEYEAYQNGQTKGSTAKYIEEAKKETAERKAAEERKKQQEETIRKNKAAAEAETQREQAKIEAQKKADAEQAEKYKKQKEHEANVEQIKKETAERQKKAEQDALWKKQQEEAKERIAERERMAKWEEQQKEAKRRVEQKEQAEQQAKYMNNVEAIKKAEEEKRYNETVEKGKEIVAENKRKDAETKQYIDNSMNEILSDYKDIYKGITACAEKRNTPFNVNNELLEIFKHRLAQKDPEFMGRWNGDIAKYVQPWMDPNIFDWDGEKDDEHKQLALDTLNEIVNEAGKNLQNNTTYETAKEGGTYLTNLKKDYKTTRDNTITEDLAKAKIALSKVYLGESDSLKNLDPALKKVIDSKIEEVDDDYDGDLVAYIRPWIFGKWLPDETDYAKVEDILEEMERELKSGKKDDEIYAEYIDKIKDQVF